MSDKKIVVERILKMFTHEEVARSYLVALEREDEKDLEIKELKLTINELRNKIDRIE